MKRVPKPGTSVRFTPNPASFALYSKPPRPGAVGTVTTVPLGGGKKTHHLRGPGGGLVYVYWGDGQVQGVSLYDLSPA